VDSSRFHSSPIPFLPHILSKILLIGERWPKHNNKIIYLKLILMVLFSKTVKNSDEESLIIVKISIQWILMCRTHRPNRIGHRSYVVEIQGHKKMQFCYIWKTRLLRNCAYFKLSTISALAGSKNTDLGTVSIEIHLQFFEFAGGYYPIRLRPQAGINM
jgi:hypothetical protein